MKRAKSIEARRNDAVEQKQQLLRDIEQNDSLILRPLDFHSPVLAEAKGFRWPIPPKTGVLGAGF